MRNINKPLIWNLTRRPERAVAYHVANGFKRNSSLSDVYGQGETLENQSLMGYNGARNIMIIIGDGKSAEPKSKQRSCQEAKVL